MSASAKVGKLASASGLSRTSVVVGLLMFMFLAFVTARGSLSQYKSALLG